MTTIVNKDAFRRWAIRNFGQHFVNSKKLQSTYSFSQLYKLYPLNYNPLGES